MKLFDYLTRDIEYSECAFLMDAVCLVYAEIKSLGIAWVNVIDIIREELGLWYSSSFYKGFDELNNSDIFKEALSNVLCFEDLDGTFNWDVAEVVVGLILIHGPDDLRMQLSELPYGDG